MRRTRNRNTGGQCSACKVRRSIDMKARALKILGESCVCCDESNSAFLQIDHVVPVRVGRQSGNNNWGLIVRGVLSTDGLQTLCANCNISKGVGSWCKGHGNYLGPIQTLSANPDRLAA